MSHDLKLEAEILCCLSDDKHIIQNGVLLKCRGHACHKCAVRNEVNAQVKCNHCLEEHRLDEEFQNSVIDIKSTIELLIQSNCSRLTEMFTKRFQNKQRIIGETSTDFVDARLSTN
jgi:hypothetical protein